MSERVRSGGDGLGSCAPSMARWYGRPSCGVWFGEAANPGHPHVRLLVTNVTSWCGSWRGLVAAGADMSGWSGWPLRGMRVGEADNPGPDTVRLLVANVTRWSAAWRGLLASDAAV